MELMKRGKGGGNGNHRRNKKNAHCKGNIKGGFLPPLYYLKNFNLGFPKGFKALYFPLYKRPLTVIVNIICPLLFQLFIYINCFFMAFVAL